MAHILIVDDDTSIRTILSLFLSEQGFVTSQAADGNEMFAILENTSVDLLLLDIMMPGEDGLALCRRLQNNNPLPVILLTAMDGETDRIIGLELGADDYVAKPFSPGELLARIHALLRRVNHERSKTPFQKSSLYVFSGWTIDVQKRTLISPDNVLVVLTSTEFDLLTLFIENPQTALNRDVLLEALHGRMAHAFDRAIDVQVSRLRRKIEPDPQNPTLIKTIRHEGYFFASDVIRRDMA
ncbi:response regulator [Martelella alba]|uniref:Response regulator n=1 Tax=Martelella alba TaxID=2590451 RepID=A0ABY2SEV0_9HYPH|nr:response regulator [Martelella alba]TKI03361.1 response regulator [Martelella alba]